MAIRAPPPLHLQYATKKSGAQASSNMDAALATPEKRKTPSVAIKQEDKASAEKKVTKKEPEDNQAQRSYAPIENDPYYQKEDGALAQAFTIGGREPTSGHSVL